MFCKNCGNKLKDGNTFCDKCGTANDELSTVSKTPVKKNRRKFIAVIIVILIIALVAGGGFAYYKISSLMSSQHKGAAEAKNVINSTPQMTEKPISETKSPETKKAENQNRKVSDYIDGALRHIVVPPGMSIEIPNISDGSLPIQWKGVANIMEITEDQKIQSNGYNEASTSGSVSIKRHARVVLQNSGSADVIVSVSADYTEYSETDLMVYDTIELSNGESVSFTAKQDDTIYIDDSVYDYIEYKVDNMSLESSGVQGSRSVNISERNIHLITATEPVVIRYCPSTIERIMTEKSAFDTRRVASGETVRIYATDKSKNVIYTDGNRCDYVIYGTDGTVKQQQQDVKMDSISINKDCYVDFTNVSANQIEIKIPNLDFKIEER